MTDQESIFLSVESNEEVQCQKFGPPSTVHLVARCLENRTSLYITGDCHVASGFYGYGKVTVRLDDGKPFNRNMDASTDNQALGLWSGGEAIPLLKQMLGKERMIARFTPFSSDPVEPSFDISGLDAVISTLREACGW
jgi:type VI secretion system protein VasI